MLHVGKDKEQPYWLKVSPFSEIKAIQIKSSSLK
jgi:hypothetical protein